MTEENRKRERPMGRSGATPAPWHGNNEKPPIGDSCLLGISTRFLKRIVRCSTIIIVLI